MGVNFTKQHRKNSNLIWFISGLLCIIVIMVWALAFFRSMQAFHEGEFYFEDRQYIRAITYFDRSIRWYTPFNPYITKSAEQLMAIGRKAEAQDDTLLSLIAYRTIRRGYFAVNNFYQPGKEMIEQCESHIYRLTKLQMEIKGGREGTKSFNKEDLFKGKANRPGVLWSIIVEIGFLGWIGTILGLIISKVSPGKEPESQVLKNIKWAGIIIVFYTMWIMGMVNA
ncbi:hypothetical protein ACFL0H_09410 [Thermodesulfobacteriota bacterium]